METTQRKFAEYYGINQGVVSVSIRDYEVDFLRKPKGKHESKIYDEKAIAEAVKAHYKHEADKLRKKALVYDDLVQSINLKYDQHYVDVHLHGGNND